MRKTEQVLQELRELETAIAIEIENLCNNIHEHISLGDFRQVTEIGKKVTELSQNAEKIGWGIYAIEETSSIFQDILDNLNKKETNKQKLKKELEKNRVELEDDFEGKIHIIIQNYEVFIEEENGGFIIQAPVIETKGVKKVKDYLEATRFVLSLIE